MFHVEHCWGYGAGVAGLAQEQRASRHEVSHLLDNEVGPFDRTRGDRSGPHVRYRLGELATVYASPFYSQCADDFAKKSHLAIGPLHEHHPKPKQYYCERNRRKARPTPHIEQHAFG